MQAFLVTMHAVFTFYANRGFQVGGVPVSYQWRELPQVSFLSRQTRTTKHVFYCNKSMLVATNIFLW